MTPETVTSKVKAKLQLEKNFPHQQRKKKTAREVFSPDVATPLDHDSPLAEDDTMSSMSSLASYPVGTGALKKVSKARKEKKVDSKSQ